MLTQDEVIWGFRYCLGRDPESADVIMAHRNFNSWAELRNALLHCPEFVGSIGGSEFLATQPGREQFINGLYQTLLNRTPDEAGFAANLKALEQGLPPHALIAAFLNSPEFATICRSRALLTIELPDLRSVYPDLYCEEGEGTIYVATDNDRIRFMETMIANCRYYDRLGVWGESIDRDKKNMAQLVECFGAKSCLEIGCFNGPILSLLCERGIEVLGIDPSHLAFVLAFPNIRENMIWGDLSRVAFHKKFDCIIALDVLEHVSPLALHEHIRRIKIALAEHGVVIVNSPMFGRDEVFGTVFEQYLSEWRAVGDRDFFRHWHCDPLGWPMHGHMVWASPAWWERQFETQGLVRVREVEIALQECLSRYFAWAPARKSLFILCHQNAHIDVDSAISELHKNLW